METRRNYAEHQRMCQNVVVPREITDRQPFDARRVLRVPMRRAQGFADGAQIRFRYFTFPEGFLRFF